MTASARPALTRDPATFKLGIAWISLCLALALHVIDEASTGFLSVYNPTVLALRAKLGFWPMPTFEFREWLTGLIVVVLVLLALSPLVFKGVRWMRPIFYVFAVIMLLNGLGHTAGTILGHTREFSSVSAADAGLLLIPAVAGDVGERLAPVEAHPPA
jgi:hypothetical protein